MKLIVGLGNPGKKYENNRHNVGFMVIDAFVTQNSPREAGRVHVKAQNYNSKLKSEVWTLEALVLAKPQTYMNESGRAVKKLTSAYSLLPSALCVVHDDLDIPLGEYKIQKGKGPKLHRGIESIDKALGTSEYWRVRVGVENRRVPRVVGVPRVPRGEAYVLQDFTQEECVIVERVIKDVVAQLIARSGAD